MYVINTYLYLAFVFEVFAFVQGLASSGYLDANNLDIYTNTSNYTIKPLQIWNATNKRTVKIVTGLILQQSQQIYICHIILEVWKLKTLMNQMDFIWEPIKLCLEIGIKWKEKGTFMIKCIKTKNKIVLKWNAFQLWISYMYVCILQLQLGVFKTSKSNEGEKLLLHVRRPGIKLFSRGSCLNSTLSELFDHPHLSMDA